MNPKQNQLNYQNYLHQTHEKEEENQKIQSLHYQQLMLPKDVDLYESSFALHQRLFLANGYKWFVLYNQSERSEG
jgi:hypothetical protein